jgi:hypothetical protein
MNPAKEEADLAFAVQFALTQYKYKPPPRFDYDPDRRERYYRSIAMAVAKQIALSWEFKRKPRSQFVP